MATHTSIQAYHAHEAKPTQKLRIAEYCEKETKAGRLVWIRKICDHFHLKGERDLSQKSTVSPRFGEIKADGIEYNGRRYVLKLVKEARPEQGQPLTEMYAFVIEQQQGEVQATMF